MAIIYNQNVAFNYRGILNLDATTINTPLDATLRAVTDGTGTSSVLNLSTTQVNIGGGTSLGRLTVRGDGTNPVARFESSAGTRSFSISASGDAFSLGNNDVTLYVNNGAGSSSLAGSSWSLASAASSGGGYGGRVYNVSPLSATSGTTGLFSIGDLGGTFSAGAGSGNFRPLNLAYTINNSGAQTGNATGLFLNATETALNGMTHNLMDLQVGGVSKFLVANNGAITCFGNSSIPVIKMSAINDFTNAVSIFLFSATTGRTIFGGDRFQLNGTTNLFPAIKRNGAAIDFRLADDSNFCNVNANGITISSGNIELTQSANVISNINAGSTGLIVKANGSSSVALDVLGSSTTSNNIQRWRNASAVTLSFIDGFGGAMFGGTTKTASAFVQIDSTTQGLLPPRQTTTQINAIVSPAEGLVIYNTTISHLCVYQAGGWVKISHSPM